MTGVSLQMEVVVLLERFHVLYFGTLIGGFGVRIRPVSAVFADFKLVPT